jgi:hypothetical protein
MSGRGTFRVKRWRGTQSLNQGGIAIKKFLGRIAVGRALGEHPSPIKAVAASAIVGTAVGGLTYRLLRGGGADESDQK